MLITSDQDNTVAYGRTNTMRRHIYTNKAWASPSYLQWMTEQGHFRHREDGKLNQNKIIRIHSCFNPESYWSQFKQGVFLAFMQTHNQLIAVFEKPKLMGNNSKRKDSSVFKELLTKKVEATPHFFTCLCLCAHNFSFYRQMIRPRPCLVFLSRCNICISNTSSEHKRHWGLISWHATIPFRNCFQLCTHSFPFAFHQKRSNSRLLTIRV